MPRDGSEIFVLPFPDVDEDTTIESAVYNGFTNDVAQDLNSPRPIIAGGTGATSAEEALENLGGELAEQLVTNYDSHLFQSGSFCSTATATAEPVDGHAFSGIVYITDDDNMVVEARDSTDGKLYIRRKTAGVWSTWALDGDLSGVNADIEAIEADITALETDKLAKAGGTMTGDLVLVGDPDQPLEASTKQYTDAGDTAAKAYADTKDAAALTAANAAYQAKDPQLFAGIPLVAGGSGSYTTQLVDAQKCIVGANLTTTINNALAYPDGTVLTFAAFGGIHNVALSANTLYFNQGGAILTGTRAISNTGIATAIKMASGAWVISGSGIT